MDRQRISAIAHSDHRVAAPVAPEEVARLVAQLDPERGGRVVDLGCGWGLWLIELLSQRPDLRGIGVDIALPDDVHLAESARGVAGRIAWVEADASDWGDGTFDAVLCVGASHAFGGLSGTLAAVRRSLQPGGCVLLGDAVWEAAPTPEALEALGAEAGDFPSLAEFVDESRKAGFEPVQGHISTLAEWDQYEWAWTGSLAAWALAPGRDPDQRAHALEAARTHREQWLQGYRGVLGFATLALRDLNPFGISAVGDDARARTPSG